MSEQAKQLYKFDGFELDLRKHLLWRDGALLPLAPKLADTLCLLVEHEGDVVEKQELLARVWPDTVVEENSLTQNISSLRRVLGTTANGSQYIETVAKRGYRFVCERASSVREDGNCLPEPLPVLTDHTSASPSTPPASVPGTQSALGTKQFNFQWQVSKRNFWLILSLLSTLVLIGVGVVVRSSEWRGSQRGIASDIPIIGIHPRWYDFEEGTDGWISASSGMITQLVSSDVHSYKGHRSLAITFGGPFKPKTQVYVLDPKIPPGDFVMAHIWCPRENNLTSIALFVEEGNGSWDNDWESQSNIVFGSWTGFRMLLPTDAASPVRRVGVEFTSHAQWTGTCYLDSVEWVPSW